MGTSFKRRFYHLGLRISAVGLVLTQGPISQPIISISFFACIFFGHHKRLPIHTSGYAHMIMKTSITTNPWIIVVKPLICAIRGKVLSCFEAPETIFNVN